MSAWSCIRCSPSSATAPGRLTGFQGLRAPSAGALRESFIHIHVERVDEETRRAEIVRRIADVLADVRVAVQDWRAMTARVAELIAELKANPPPLPVDEIAEAVQFLEWLLADNFTFLGIAQLPILGRRRRPRADVRERARRPAHAQDAGAALVGPAARHHAGNPRAPERADAC